MPMSQRSSLRFDRQVWSRTQNLCLRTRKGFPLCLNGVARPPQPNQTSCLCLSTIWATGTSVHLVHRSTRRHTWTGWRRRGLSSLTSIMHRKIVRRRGPRFSPVAMPSVWEWMVEYVFPMNPKALNPSEYTMARMFKDAGYATGCFGKWHLGHRPGYLPNDHGFDVYEGIPYSNDMWAPMIP